MKKIFATIALIAIGSMAYTYAQNNNLQQPDPDTTWHFDADDWDACPTGGSGCTEVTVWG